MPVVTPQYLAYRFRVDVFVSQMLNSQDFRQTMTSLASTKTEIEQMLKESNIFADPTEGTELGATADAVIAFRSSGPGGTPFNAWMYIKNLIDTLYGSGGYPPGPPMN